MIESDSTEILVVDDNNEDVELTLRALKGLNLGNNIKVVNDGQEAIEFIFGIGRYPADSLRTNLKVILLDLRMPKVNGMEVLEKIKNDPQTKLIPVVVVTSSQQINEISSCYNMGANSYVVKPVNFDAYIKAVSDTGLYWLMINKPVVE